nr:hypothetical protein [uncultured Gellertiella sp.]
MMRPRDHGFFVGYFKKVPADVRRFVLAFAAFFVTAFVAGALLLALDTPSPGSGGFDPAESGRVLAGVVEAAPYPVLRIPAMDGHPAHAVMMAGAGKFGAQDFVAKLDGRSVMASGGIFKRGDLDMLVVGGENAFMRPDAPSPANPYVPESPVDLGRWRLTGEICDGKCAAGAMRPGTGLAHKACANLCISGGVPPVFVSTSPVHGSLYFLLASKTGGPMPSSLADRTGVPVELEGRIELRDDLPVFKVEDGK